MSYENTEYGGCRGCKRGCNDCGSGDNDNGGTIVTGMSINQRTLVPANMRLLNNQQGINIIIAKFATAHQILAQFQSFTGVMTKTVPALTINLNLEDPPVHSLVNVTTMVNDGVAQPGILKVGGACMIRIYKMAGYQGGATRRFTRSNRDRCTFMFREGEEVSMQGNSLSWISSRWNARRR